MAMTNPFRGACGISARKRWLKAAASVAGSGSCDASEWRMRVWRYGRPKRSHNAKREVRSVASIQRMRNVKSTEQRGPRGTHGSKRASSPIARDWMSAGVTVEWGWRIVPSVESRFFAKPLYTGELALFKSWLRSTVLACRQHVRHSEVDADDLAGFAGHNFGAFEDHAALY